MSTFAVTKERIATVERHPNADRLDIATLEGMSFRFIVGRDQFKPGAEVVYFPVDSLMPADVLGDLGLTGKLHGAERNRVKTMKLRGCISQGLVAEAGRFTPEQLAAVSKFEADSYEFRGAKTFPPSLMPLPCGLSKYDIEGCQRYGIVMKTLLDLPMEVTEKIEGTNIAVTAADDGMVYVSQRSYGIKEEYREGNMYWESAERCGLIAAARKMLAEARYSRGAGSVTIRGELIGPGIQKNIYGLDERVIMVFDVMLNDQYLDPGDPLAAGLNWAPILSIGKTLREWLSGRTIEDASAGQSLLTMAPQLREGIVIKPMHGRYSELIGRVILKQRSPEYLAGSDL